MRTKKIVATLRELGDPVQPEHQGRQTLLIGVAGLNMLGEVKSESKAHDRSGDRHCGWAGSPVYILRSDAVRLVECPPAARLFIKPLNHLDPCLYPGTNLMTARASGRVPSRRRCCITQVCFGPVGQVVGTVRLSHARGHYPVRSSRHRSSGRGAFTANTTSSCDA